MSDTDPMYLDRRDDNNLTDERVETVLEEQNTVEVGDDGVVIPIVAEQLAVGKQIVQTGRVHVHTDLQERVETVDLPLLRKTVSTVTVPINRMIVGPMPTPRQEGDTLIVPVCEEVLVVEKRWMLKEELHIRQQEETFHEPQSVVLRREEVSVERTQMDVPNPLDSEERSATLTPSITTSATPSMREQALQAELGKE